MVQDGVYELAIVTEADAERVHALHLSKLTRHMFPRDTEFFAERARREELYVLQNAQELAAVCYVYSDQPLDSPTPPAHFEFGGLYVHESLRQKGYAKHLAAFAIGNHYSNSALTPRGALVALIAHVHVRNPDPRPVLRRLGFVHTNTIRLEAMQVPDGIDTEHDGGVLGDEFHFNVVELTEIVQVLSAWKCGAKITLPGLDHRVPLITSALSEMAEELKKRSG